MSEKQIIIGLSARKQGGKNTAINFIYGIHMLALGIIKNTFNITEKGQLYVKDIFGDISFEGIFDIDRDTPEMEQFLAEHLNQFVKVYNFADLLKTEVCMKILGLTYEQCYGTDEQKNAFTHLMWENMPGVFTNNGRADFICNILKYKDDFHNNLLKDVGDETFFHPPGFMTAREVMQYVGTNVFRKMYGNVWVDATIRRIKDEGSQIALIADCRFPNEVEGIQNNNGKVIRLNRNPHPEDKHESETALDKENFEWNKFDSIIDNANSTIDEQNKQVYNVLKKWNLLPVELDI